MAGFNMIDSSFVRSSIWGTCYQIALQATKKSLTKRRVIDTANFTVILFQEIASLQPSETTTLISQ